VKARLRAMLSVEVRRREALLALFDHTAGRAAAQRVPDRGVRASATLGEMTELYRRHALTLGRDVAARALAAGGVRADEIDLFVTVSCTGILIPSLDAYLVDELGFRRDVRRLPLTELGCAGGAAALSRAHDFLRGFPDARALVVAVELPSLSLQRDDLSPANLVSTALFGDGAAAALLEGGARRGARDGRAHAARALHALAHLPAHAGRARLRSARRRLSHRPVEGRPRPAQDRHREPRRLRSRRAWASGARRSRSS
jgi:alkylresorcinol/alkylpyrone synthase